MVILVAILASLVIGFFAANVLVGKQAAKKVRHVKAVRPQLSIEDKIMMRAGYASYVGTTVHLQDGDHHYLMQYANGHLVPFYEVVMQGNEFDLVKVGNEENIYAQ